MRRDEPQIWEVGGVGAPPELLDGLMEPGERLLWAARLPSSRFDTFRVYLIFVSLLVTMLFLYLAPWGTSISEHCPPGADRTCRKLYFLSWPLVACGAYLSIGTIYIVWQSKTSPWCLAFGVSTRRAIFLDEKRPKNTWWTAFATGKARIDRFGSVRFGKSRSAVSFPGLEASVASRAVYWANEGRFEVADSTGTAP